MADEIFAGLQFDNTNKLVKAYNKVLMAMNKDGSYAFDNCSFRMQQGNLDLGATETINLGTNTSYLSLGESEFSANASIIFFGAKDANNIGTEFDMGTNSMTLSGASSLTLTAEDIYIKGAESADGYSHVHISDVVNPTLDTDAANKYYVDGAAEILRDSIEDNKTLFINYGAAYSAQNIIDQIEGSEPVEIIVKAEYDNHNIFCRIREWTIVQESNVQYPRVVFGGLYWDDMQGGLKGYTVALEGTTWRTLS